MKKKVFELDFHGRKIVVEHGELAKQADGAVLVRHNDTVILTAAVVSKNVNLLSDFFPLTVNGKKSLNKLTFLDTTAAVKITVSLYLTRTAPSACFASSPCSTTIFLPWKSNSNTFFILTPHFQKKETLKKCVYFLNPNFLITSR